MSAYAGALMRSPRLKRGLPRISAPVIAGALAVMAALAGMTLLAQTAATTTALVGLNTEAQGETLSVWVNRVELVDVDEGAGAVVREDEGPTIELGRTDFDPVATDDGGEGGFDMPSSMTPGTPAEGFQRLQVELDLMNRLGGVTAAEPLDFELEESDGTRWGPLTGGTFRPTELRSQQVLATIIAFDIPDTLGAEDVQLVWFGDGKEIHFAVDAEGGGHSHG